MRSPTTESGSTLPLARRFLLFAITAGVSSTFFINLCNLVYQCGCRSLWAGAEASCNIHAATGPHCPWCASHWAGGFVFISVLAVQTAIVFTPGKAGFWSRGAAALLAFPLVGGILGVAVGLIMGYWSQG